MEVDGTSRATSHPLVPISAFLLGMAGLMWVVKAGVIMLAGSQPPLTFELGQLLFPFAAGGLYFATPQPGRIQKIGVALAMIAVVGSGLALLYPFFSGALIPTSEEFLIPYSLFVLSGAVGGFVGLTLVAAAFSRARRDLGWRRFIPLIIALLPLPLLLADTIHFEMPIFMIGVIWMALAFFLWSLS